MKIDSSRESEPRISDESALQDEKSSAASSTSESAPSNNTDAVEEHLEPFGFDKATEGASSNAASSSGEAEDGSVDGVSLAEIQRREKLFASQLADAKLAAVGDVDAYKRLVVSQTGKEPTRKELETFQLGGGLPLLGMERQQQLLGDPITSKEYSDRWNTAWADYKKGLSGDLEAWKRYNAAVNGRQIDFDEEFQFEDGGGPSIGENQRQMDLLGVNYPQEHLDRMAQLQDVVEKAINGDAKAQSKLEAAFGMTPGALAGDTLKNNPTMAGALQNIVNYRPDTPQPGTNETPKSESKSKTETEGWGFHAWAGNPENQQTPSASSETSSGIGPGSDPSEWEQYPGSSSSEEPASDPSEWSQFPGNPSDNPAAVGVNAVDVHDDGSVLILLSDGTSKEFSSVGEAMEWQKQSGVGAAPAGNSSTAGSGTPSGSGQTSGSESTSTTQTSTSTTAAEEPEESEEEEAVEEEETEGGDDYVNPDFVDGNFASTELSAAGKLKVQGGGFTDGRPELTNTDAPEIDPNKTWGSPNPHVTDPSPEGDPMSIAEGSINTLKLNNSANPETRPELQGDGPEARDDSGINPYAGKG
jgi:hypothetical protein